MTKQKQFSGSVLSIISLLCGRLNIQFISSVRLFAATLGIKMYEMLLTPTQCQERITMP